MDIQKLIEPAADWTGQHWAARIDQCASLLFLHGYITQSQRTKITEKLEKQFRDGLASGKIVPASSQVILDSSTSD
jgi:mannitol/fructose-specific phosphotransferase system IIA component (Ntr-type)